MFNSSDFVDPDAVDLLVSFLKKHKENVGIILSSSWRKFDVNDTIKFSETTKLKPIAPCIIGVTPRIFVENSVRGDEIKFFIEHLDDEQQKHLRKSNFKLDKYVIVDDDSDMLQEQMDNFVHVNGEIGLINSDLDNIEKILDII